MPAPNGRCSTVLFDLDGTLIDSIELILSSYRHTLETHRGTRLPDEFWLRGIGTPLRAQLSRLSDDPEELDAMVATYRAHNLAHHDRMVCAYDGVAAALERLAAAGCAMAVVTSKLKQGALRGLERCGLQRYFRAIVGADDTALHKPHPEPVHRALALLGAEPGRTVFVGDSPHDLAAGRAAGVKTAAALWGPFPRQELEPWKPDHWLEKPQDLVDWIERDVTFQPPRP
jgi:pyrophosphatase PpaX